MKETDYILVQAPMVSELHLTGSSLMLFAMIYSFTRDGKHTFHGSFNYISEWLSIDRRTVIETVDILERSGYINVTQVKDGERTINEYTTNYDELLERAKAGEDIRPLKRQRRGKNPSKIHIGGEIPPSFTTNQNGGEMAEKLVVNAPKIGGECTSIDKYNINIYNNYCCYYAYPQAHAREVRPFEQQEQQELYIRFYLRNAAKPRDEVARFVAFNTQKGWKSEKEIYDTPEKRFALSVGWEFKGNRIDLGTENGCYQEAFYQTLAALYMCDKVSGAAVDDRIYFNERSSLKVNSPSSFLFIVPMKLRDRIEDNHVNTYKIIRNYFPSINNLQYMCYEL